MQKILLATLLALLIAPFARAGNTPPDFDSARWSALTKKIITEGQRSDHVGGSLLTLSRINPPDETIARKAEYISVIGRYVEDIFRPLEFVFVPSEVSSVIEAWTPRENGYWEVDQWIRNSNMNGELIRVVHVRLVKKGISIPEYTRLPVGAPSDPEELKGWGEVLNGWY